MLERGRKWTSQKAIGSSWAAISGFLTSVSRPAQEFKGLEYGGSPKPPSEMLGPSEEGTTSFLFIGKDVHRIFFKIPSSM